MTDLCKRLRNAAAAMRGQGHGWHQQLMGLLEEAAVALDVPPSGPSDGTLAKERHDRCRYMLTLLNELAECNDYSKRQSIADGLARDIAETVSCWLPSTATDGGNK